MKEAIKNNKKVIIVGIAIILILLIGIAFAYLTTTIFGEKEYAIRAGSLGLVLEEDNELTLEKLIPMEDSEGMTLTGFDFRLINQGKIDTDYTIYLDDIPLDSGETIKSFEIKSEDNSNIFTSVAYMKNNISFSIGSSMVSSYNTHKTSTTIKEEDGIWNVYLVIGPTDATDGKNITITVKDVNYTESGGDVYTATLYGLPAIEAGKVYVTPEITMTKQQ